MFNCVENKKIIKNVCVASSSRRKIKLVICNASHIVNQYLYIHSTKIGAEHFSLIIYDRY